MELRFFHERAAEMDPKLLIDCIQRTDAAFFPTALSLVYDKLVETELTKHTRFDPGPGGCTKGDSPIHPTPPPSTSAYNIPSSSAVNTIASSSNLQAPARTYGRVPSIMPRLKCHRCGQVARSGDLREGLYCPQCPRRGKKARPLMQCTSCDTVRTTIRDDCEKKVCRKRFL